MGQREPFAEVLSIWPEAGAYMVDNPVSMRRELYTHSGKIWVWLNRELIDEMTQPAQPWGTYPSALAARAIQ